MSKAKNGIGALVTGALVLSLVSSFTNSSLHMVFGILFVAAALMHVFMNRKWLIRSIKASLCKKLKQKPKKSLLSHVGLCTVILLIAGSGLALFMLQVSGSVTTHLFFHLHIALAVLCVVMTVLHVHSHVARRAGKKRSHRLQQEPFIRETKFRSLYILPWCCQFANMSSKVIRSTSSRAFAASRHALVKPLREKRQRCRLEYPAR